MKQFLVLSLAVLNLCLFSSEAFAERVEFRSSTKLSVKINQCEKLEREAGVECFAQLNDPVCWAGKTAGLCARAACIANYLDGTGCEDLVKYHEETIEFFRSEGSCYFNCA